MKGVTSGPSVMGKAGWTGARGRNFRLGGGRAAAGVGVGWKLWAGWGDGCGVGRLKPGMWVGTTPVTWLGGRYSFMFGCATGGL